MSFTSITEGCHFNSACPFHMLTLYSLEYFRTIPNFILLLLCSDNLIAEAAGGNTSVQALKDADEKAFKESEVNSII